MKFEKLFLIIYAFLVQACINHRHSDEPKPVIVGEECEQKLINEEHKIKTCVSFKGNQYDIDVDANNGDYWISALRIKTLPAQFSSSVVNSCAANQSNLATKLSIEFIDEHNVELNKVIETKLKLIFSERNMTSQVLVNRSKLVLENQFKLKPSSNWYLKFENVFQAAVVLNELETLFNSIDWVKKQNSLSIEQGFLACDLASGEIKVEISSSYKVYRLKSNQGTVDSGKLEQAMARTYTNMSKDYNKDKKLAVVMAREFEKQLLEVQLESSVSDELFLKIINAMVFVDDNSDPALVFPSPKFMDELYLKDPGETIGEGINLIKAVFI